ncbi:MAG: hypothetical protein NVSMB27_35280 [Ktedonobacteraceae bacterium]
MERQAEQLRQYGTTRGDRVVTLIIEAGSGVNDSRPKLLSLLGGPLITRLVVEQQDQLTRFGFRSSETSLDIQGRTMEVVNCDSSSTCNTYTNSAKRLLRKELLQKRLFVIIAK